MRARRRTHSLTTGPVLALLLGCTAAERPGPDRPEPAPPRTAARIEVDGAASEAPAMPREPPRLLTDPGSGVGMVWSGAAADAVVAEAELVVLEPDGRHLGAVAWADGEARWRIELPTSAAARLYSLGDRILVHDRTRVVVVEAARGRVLGRHEAPPPGRGWDGYVAQRRGDACAWVSGCGIQAFDCSDGAVVGPYLPSSEVHLYGLSGDPSEHSTSCSPPPQLLGRVGATTVLVAAAPRVDEQGRPAGLVPALVGQDARSGQLRWQQPLPSEYPTTGMTADGACWSLDDSAPGLTVLDCETGTLRWERDLGPGVLRVHAIDDTLVVARDYGGRWRLSAYAIDDGRSAWSTRLAKRQHPVLPGSVLPEAHTTGKRRVYVLLDPAKGERTGELVAGRDEELWRDPAGGFVLTGRELRELDPQGRLTRQRPYPGSRVHSVLADHVLTQDGETVEIYDRDQLRERARVEGRMVIQPTAMPHDRLLLRRADDDGVALLLQLASPGRR
ncbi:MAG: PQQ-binding-like beta-propeller repeat protein [Nannocystaceae bacterium]